MPRAVESTTKLLLKRKEGDEVYQENRERQAILKQLFATSQCRMNGVSCTSTIFSKFLLLNLVQ